MSDDEEHYEPRAHQKLLQAIGSLGKVQHIHKSTRDEHQSRQDEFQLMKSVSSAETELAPRSVGLNDLVDILRTSSKHREAGKKLKNVQGTRKVLAKPLEKPAADRIRRTIGYEGVTKKLGRWDAVVAQQRSAETQVFPLHSDTIYVNTSASARPLNTRTKSNLARELEASNLKLRELRKAQIGDTTDEQELAKQERQLLQKKLTRDELFARRKELAYLKMRESQKSAKARMQNKIKSKKFHKLQKRQKILEQMKEFELLQKTNPEAALEKLNALEKSRVQERASLRHKNTGTWAKNLQVRAKYDKDVRKDLAEQLAVSRELTQKKQESDSEEDESSRKRVAPDEEDNDYDPFNPWTKRKTVETAENGNGEGEDSNWRQYWTKRNRNEKLLEEHRRDMAAAEHEQETKEQEEHEQETKEQEEKEQNTEDEEEQKEAPKKPPAKAKTAKKITKKSNVKTEKAKKIVKKSKVKMENGWQVEEVEPKKLKEKSNASSIEDIFEKHEEQLRAKLSKKLDKLKQRVDKLKVAPVKGKKAKKKDALKNLKSLALKKTKQQIEIDEPLNHGEEKEEPQKKVPDQLESNPETTKNPTVDTIDPNKVTTLVFSQKKTSSSGINDALMDDEAAEYDEADAAAERQLTISQAFEDDDIIADFNRDKTKDSELKNTELQLALPGWGSWAGAGISQAVMERRNKRLLLRLAAPEKRRDDNKDNLYVNESASKMAREHMVSSIPFPFRSLADYEASIRAPIGRNFVPETAFRMLTRPAVITRKGHVIEPMTESELVKPVRRLRHIVDSRIKRLAKVPPKAKIA
ncbi:U3 small nucleolar RNA-associated protein 14 homolog A [Drosophila elegans]|uniref:U3 small nucleolar RNA-associated protein 14 homolog A n=1 Tax=Drosophila elegans TaxID=30023 RepID=UPI0007E62304|nr:U3 small nucleolar RNA-associated protein 14 homolog A [Drosophila elegans]